MPVALRYPDAPMASLALETGPRTGPEQPTRHSGELIDFRAVAADLESLAETHSGGGSELRSALAQRLKTALNEGRAKAEQLLLNDRHGRRCAERLCRLEDEIIRLLFEFARKHLYQSQNPSEAEHMAVIATGGYGRGLQAPGSDIDLLFLLALQADRLGRVDRGSDPLLPVGHRTEGRPCHALGGRMHPPGQGGHDHPHRHPRSRDSCSATRICSTNW